MNRFRHSLVSAGKRQRRALFFLFPLFLNLALYANLIPPASLAAQTPRFAFDLPGLARFVLSWLLLTIVFFLLSSIVSRRPWLAALLLALPLFVISIVDFYKYYALGSRISAEDIAMVFSLTDLWTPKGAAGAGLFFSPMLFVTGPLLAAYIWRMKKLGIQGPRLVSRRLTGGVLALWLFASFSMNSLAYQIFDPQLQDYQVFPSSQHSPQLSSIDCLIGSLYYDEFTDERATAERIQQIMEPYAAQGGEKLRPDIIVIMSESYFDLNRVQGLELKEDLYQNFRRMQDQGASGRIVVPAFGGGTASTEFEVLSGLPNASLRGTRSPYGDIGAQDHLPSFRDYFGQLGYRSAYIHPFKGSFYNRQNAFAAMGFDQILFQEDLTVPIRDYSRDMHIGDETLTDQIIAQLEEGQGQPQLIWATSMQNHTPYVQLAEDDPILVKDPSGLLSEGELEGLNAYAVGIRDTDRALGRLLDAIDRRERPTALLFFGDHQPLLEGYKKLNRIANDQIYETLDCLTTDYAIYANYPASFASIDGDQKNRIERPFSAYYLMDVLITALDLPKTPCLSLLDQALQALPIYSLSIQTTGSDPEQARRCQDALDILAYDRTRGRQYSLKWDKLNLLNN